MEGAALGSLEDGGKFARSHETVISHGSEFHNLEIRLK